MSGTQSEYFARDVNLHGSTLIDLIRGLVSKGRPTIAPFSFMHPSSPGECLRNSSSPPNSQEPPSPSADRSGYDCQGDSLPLAYRKMTSSYHPAASDCSRTEDGPVLPESGQSQDHLADPSPPSWNRKNPDSPCPTDRKAGKASQTTGQKRPRDGMAALRSAAVEHLKHWGPKRRAILFDSSSPSQLATSRRPVSYVRLPDGKAGLFTKNDVDEPQTSSDEDVVEVCEESDLESQPSVPGTHHDFANKGHEDKLDQDGSDQGESNQDGKAIEGDLHPKGPDILDLGSNPVITDEGEAKKSHLDGPGIGPLDRNVDPDGTGGGDAPDLDADGPGPQDLEARPDMVDRNAEEELDGEKAGPLGPEVINDESDEDEVLVSTRCTLCVLSVSTEL